MIPISSYFQQAHNGVSDTGKTNRGNTDIYKQAILSIDSLKVTVLCNSTDKMHLSKNVFLKQEPCDHESMTFVLSECHRSNVAVNLELKLVHINPY